MYTLLIYDAKTDTCWTQKGDKTVISLRDAIGDSPTISMPGKDDWTS